MRAIALVLCISAGSWAGVAVAAGGEPDVLPVQLDARPPAELLVGYGEGDYALIAWNPDLKKWIEVFHLATGEPPQIGDLAEGKFADVTGGGYLWQWNGKGYVPRIPRASIPPTVPASDEARAVAAAALGTRVPTGTGAIHYKDADGTDAQFLILDQSAENCTGDGLICSGMVLHGDRAGPDIGAAVGYGYRIASQTNAANHRLIEQGTTDAIIWQDADSGEIVGGINAMPVRISPFQPDAPGD